MNDLFFPGECMARGPHRLCDFEIVAPPGLSKVRMKRMDHVRITAKALEREAAREIVDLKMYPQSREISRELWICSKYYFIRFFRLTDAGLVELGPDGQPLPADSPATGISRYRRVKHPVRVTAPPADTGPGVALASNDLPRVSPETRAPVPVPPDGETLSPGPGEA